MAKLEKRHIEYLNDPEFLKIYMQLLNSRLVYSNNIIENDNEPIGKLYDNANVLTLSDNYKAISILFKKLYEKNSKPLTEELIIEIANTINKHAMYISDGYRTNGSNHKLDDKYPISDSKDIPRDMKKLLDDYYGKWKKYDVFEREALFNIEFLRIHPFEDGNGRTSRLILNFNLLKQGHAPVLIKEGMRDQYFKARDYFDDVWIKQMFESLSKEELYALDELIQSYEDENKMDYVI